MKSSEGKRDQRRVKEVIDNIDFYALNIQEMLIAKRYKPSPFIVKNIRDGANKKDRVIHKPRYYPDQIIHWALMLQLESVVMKGMYEYNCGSVPKRGTELGRKTLRRWLDKDKKNTKYCLKMDIHKFYPSVENKLLKRAFRRKVKDKDCLWLIESIIDSDKGMPIGFYTSQWFSNFFLQELDHFIKQDLGIKYYVRYVDDLVLLGANKKKLGKARKLISEFLSCLDLELKSNWQVFRVKCRPIDFLGFRFYKDRTTLRRRNALRIRRRMIRVSKKHYVSYKDACAVVSYWGWIKRTNSYYFYEKYMSSIMSIKTAKKVVSGYAKARNNKKRRIDNIQYEWRIIPSY